MKITLEVSDVVEKQLEQAARRLNVPISELAAALIRDSVAAGDVEFQEAAKRVLTKNFELYKRLA